MNLAEKRRPAQQLEPNWYVQTGDGEWVQVRGVVETETPDGGGRIRLYFTGRPAMVFDKTEQVMSRRPGDGAAVADAGSSTLD